MVLNTLESGKRNASMALESADGRMETHFTEDFSWIRCTKVNSSARMVPRSKASGILVKYTKENGIRSITQTAARIGGMIYKMLKISQMA